MVSLQKNIKPVKMKNVVLSTRNIDEFISDIADEVVRKISLFNTENPSQQSANQGDLKYDVDGAADYLGVTKANIYLKKSQGILPACKAPGSKRLFFYKSDLDAYIRQGRNRTNAEIEAEAHEYLSKRKGASHG